MLTAVTITYLEMRSQTQLRPSPPSGLTVLEATQPCPELNRFFYAAIGGRWYWIDRRSWSYQQWADYLAQGTVRTWVGYLGGNPAGYFELSRTPDGSVEIAYFGLLCQFMGQGHGGYLLTQAIHQAWHWGG
jgi:ribosomal protein S18 acetylase RimI-like enzyme